MSKAKQVKLTPAQQEVVNLMAAGWELTYTPDRGRFGKAHASLRGPGNASKKIPANLPSMLCRKGVIESVKDSEWRFTTYRLTQDGRAIAQEVTKPTSKETWWRVSGEQISSQEFLRSTVTCLIQFDGQKRAKHTQWDDVFPTREAAVIYIRRRLTSDVTSAKASLARAESDLAEFERKEKLA